MWWFYEQRGAAFNGIVISFQFSSDCLNRMVDKARQLENKFYAQFTYACKKNAEYSSDCLDTGRPVYYRDLKKLAKETEQCWKLWFDAYK